MISRAFSTLSAQTAILKPGGSLTLSTGIWLAGGGGERGLIGSRPEFSISLGLPCCHIGVCAHVRLDSSVTNGVPETGCGAVLAAIANPVNAVRANRLRVFNGLSPC